MFWILVTVFAGICTGSFALPMKFTKKWQWENTWSMYAVWVLLIFPWLITLIVIPNVFEVYRSVGLKVLFCVFIFGSAWGAGCITYGLGLAYLGIGLGFSLMSGLIIVVGSLLPFVTEHPEKFLTSAGMWISAGVVVICLSIAINAVSAVKREKEIQLQSTKDDLQEKKTFLKGLGLCLFTGFFAPGLAYAFAYGNKLGLVQAALDAGANDALAANAILPIALLGGFCLNFAYTIYLVTKNKNWSLYTQKGNKRYFLYTMFMGIWTVGVALMGMAFVKLGELGPSIGWAIVSGVQIFAANIIGLLTGEWKNASRQTVKIMVLGSLLLLVGISIVGYANSL